MAEKVPAETRWVIAARTLTGACLATGNVLYQVVGKEKAEELNRRIWIEGGKTVKDVISAAGIPLDANDAKSIAEASFAAAVVTMGPELQGEIVEATKDRSVMRVTKCPWHERWKELGRVWDACTSGHQAWGEGMLEKINPDFTHKLTKNMCRGDPYCEFIIERKK